jgi:predicted MFS family arabinose efflux permease
LAGVPDDYVISAMCGSTFLATLRSAIAFTLETRDSRHLRATDHGKTFALAVDREENMRRGIILMSILALGAFTAAVAGMLFTPLLKLIAVDFGKSDAAVGQLVTLDAAATGVTALIITPWMDRFGRGALLRIGIGLLIAGTACTAFGPEFAWLVLGRLLAGVGAAFVLPVLFASAGDVFTDARQRNQAIGFVIAATSLSPLLGIPLLTQIASAAGWRWATASLLAPLVVVAAGSFLLPSGTRTATELSVRGYARHYRDLISNRETSWLLAGHLARSIPWYSALVFLGAFAITQYDMTANQLTLLFVALGGTFFIATNLMPLVIRVIPPRRLYVLSILVLFANFMSAGLLTEQWALFVFVIVFSIAGGGMSVSESVLLLDSYPEARGGVMSLRSAIGELGTALGAALFGLLLILFVDYGTAYRVLGVLLPLGLVTLFMSTRRLEIAAMPAPQVDIEPSPQAGAQG